MFGVHHFGEIFAYVTVFNHHPTIEVVTFRLRGWCLLGVFLLLAFTRLGHEYQDPGSFESVRWNACVHRPDLILYSHPIEFLEIGVRTHVKGATSQVAGSPAVLDQTVIVLDRTDIVLDRIVITVCGVLSFPSAWQWVRPSLETSLYETHQRTGPPISLLSQW